MVVCQLTHFLSLRCDRSSHNTHLLLNYIARRQAPSIFQYSSPPILTVIIISHSGCCFAVFFSCCCFCALVIL